MRDALARVAAGYGNVSLAETLRRLIDEPEERAVLSAYERLRADEDEWASHRDEPRSIAGDAASSRQPSEPSGSPLSSGAVEIRATVVGLRLGSSPAARRGRSVESPLIDRAGKGL